MKVRAENIKVGDLIDLYGDPFADPNRDPGLAFEFEYAWVMEPIDVESSDCVVIYTDSGAFGFPINHQFEIERPSTPIISELR